MRVLVLVDDLSRPGGLERSLSLKAPVWLDNGHSVIIVSHQCLATDFFIVDSRVERRELPVRYEKSGHLYSAANIGMAWRHLWSLRHMLKIVRPDVVIQSVYGWDFYLLPLVAPRAVRLVKENHSSRAHWDPRSGGLMTRVGWALRRWVENRYTFNIFLSKEEAVISGLTNVAVIPNMADPGVAPATDAERTRQIIAAGRICHVKGFDRLVRAWALAAPKLPGWRLVILGEGTESDVAALRALITSLSLDPCTELRPASRSVQAEIAHSRIYALASRSECFPMVLLEAMQLGTPIVAFDCPTGPRNIIVDGRTGILVPDGDLGAFADALVSLATQPALAHSLARAAKTAVTEYAPERVGQLWNRVFASVAA